MLKDLFTKKSQKSHHEKGYAVINVQKEKPADEPQEAPKAHAEPQKPQVQLDENHMPCPSCSAVIEKQALSDNLGVCPECSHHTRLGARRRIEITADAGSFREYDTIIKTVNALEFASYDDKLRDAAEKSGLDEAVVTGECKVSGQSCVICVMDSLFMMGSMGSVVGEKISRAVEKAIEKRLPVVIFSTSGGARMQEGMLSLMQMAKTSAALGKLDDAGLLYISVLTDPTTGGVTASFAMLGDIIVAEPKALIGFAGPRVIEQTIRQKLPEGFQRAEFLQDKGFVDTIVPRGDMKDFIGKLLAIHSTGGELDDK